MEHPGIAATGSMTAMNSESGKHDANDADRTPHPDHALLSLTGDFQRPLTLTLDQLRAQANVHADPFDLRCFTTHRFIRKVDSYRGVLLKDLIDVAGLRNDRPGDFKRTIFIAVAHDGYAVTFSWHELFNTPIGERVLIAFERGGTPLSVEDGAPLLFSAADILPAPRHVKRLAGVVARVVAP